MTNCTYCDRSSPSRLSPFWHIRDGSKEKFCSIKCMDEHFLALSINEGLDVQFGEMVVPDIESQQGYWHILEEAANVAKERGSVYGDYRLNYDRISAQCKRLGVDLSRQDLYKTMIATKLGRLEQTPDHRDSWLDLINYCAMLIDDGK